MSLQRVNWNNRIILCMDKCDQNLRICQKVRRHRPHYVTTDTIWKMHPQCEVSILKCHSWITNMGSKAHFCFSNFSNFSLCSLKLPWHIVAVIWHSYYTHETAICDNQQNSSNWDPRINRHLGYKHTLYQMLCPKKIACPFLFTKT